MMDDQLPGRLLQQAAIYNNVELMDSLLQGPERQHINVKDSFGRTALYTSVTNNSYECCRLLLHAGADPNSSCGPQCGGMTPLHAAVLDNKVQFVQLLLDNGADLNQVDASGKRAVDLAQTNCSYDCATVITAKIEADKNRKQDLHTAFVFSCRDGDVERCSQVLLSPYLMPSDIQQFVNGSHPEEDHSLLYSACCRGDAAMTSLLIENGAEVRIDGNTGLSPLHVTCLYGHAGCLEAILQHYPELAEAMMPDGNYPLHLVCASGEVSVLDVLIKVVAKLPSTGTCSGVNVTDYRRRTPLHIAVINNRVELVKRLLTTRRVSYPTVRADRLSVHNLKRTNSDRLPLVDVDAVDVDGCTPLQLAIIGNGMESYVDIIPLLLQAGADTNKQAVSADGTDVDSASPLGIACFRGDVSTVDLLLRYGACDADLSIMESVVSSNNETMIGALLQQQHSYADTKYGVNRLALVSALCELEQQQQAVDTEPMLRSACASSSAFSAFVPIMIDWHALGLPDLRLSWLCNACISHLKGSSSVQLPDWIRVNDGQLASFLITKLDISKNKLSFLPAMLFNLPSLRVLIAASNQITVIGDTAMSDDLDASCESESGVPNAVAADFNFDCPLLEEIDIKCNKLTRLPSWLFSKLPALKRCDVSSNAIEGLPDTIWTCTSLTELFLSHNRLQWLTVAQLETFVQGSPFIGCGIDQDQQRPGTPASMLSEPGPPFWHPSSSLGAHSDIDHTVIKPVHVERWHDRIQVKILTGLEYDENGVHRPDCKSHLKELDLSHNLFDELPACLACLAPSLERLNLSNNRLTCFGPIDCYPVGLRVLDLSHNSIASGELGLCSLRNGSIDSSSSTPISLPTPSLQNFRICYSPFQSKNHSSLPSNVSRTFQVRSRSPAFSMSMSATSTWSSPLSLVGVICPHRQHRHLDRLRSLRLDNNRLSRLTFSTGDSSKFSTSDDSLSSPINFSTGSSSKTVYTNAQRKRLSQQSDTSFTSDDSAHTDLLFFPNLTVLDISSNIIDALPHSISELSQLCELKISNNKIRELPSEMGLMKKLWYLDFARCPVEATLRSLLGEKAKKTASVLGYLKSVHEEATLFNRMKLMFVGVQGIGKTSLLNQLRKEESGKAPRGLHWTQRMYPDARDRGVKGQNISTVGVDIGDLVIRREGRDVIFRTWDFGGQKEYYATHQYFLTKRSLYLVVWRLIDGEKGVSGILRWLINIQARAPNSPVLIVGTHKDRIQKNHPPGWIEELGKLIELRYMPGCEPDKLGLPRVLGHAEVTCQGGLLDRSIRRLADLIWRVASEEHLPGNSGTRLLEQKVPLSYIQLQDVVGMLADERRAESKDPVLYAGQYKPLVIQKMEEVFGTSFQDISELSQATQFLHENGILLHYEDVSLQDYYFLDPQWLCDVLASVVTIREINSLARRGVMKTNDIALLFKGMTLHTDDIKTYIISLLQKFEVALLWDSDNLLIPSMLPTENELGHTCVVIPAVGCTPCPCLTSSVSRRKKVKRVATEIVEGHSTFYMEFDTQCHNTPSSSHEQLIRTFSGTSSCSSSSAFDQPNLAVSYVRLYVMSYFPCGFWPRLITRLLGDDTFGALAQSLYTVPSTNADPSDIPSPSPSWYCWQTGVELRLFDGMVALRVAEVLLDSERLSSCAYLRAQLVIPQEPDFVWANVDISGMSMLEINVPNETLLFDECTVLYPDVRATAALITYAVDRIDTLLEDWYPDVGIRFNQNTKGTYLVTRLVPCMRCIIALQQCLKSDNSAWNLVDVQRNSWLPEIIRPVSMSESSRGPCSSPHRQSSSSCGSGSQSGSSVKCNGDKTPSKHTSQKPDRTSGRSEGAEKDPNNVDTDLSVYCYVIEQCIQRAQQDRVIFCPRHGPLGPYFIASETGLIHSGHAAPDVAFQDIGDERIVNMDSVLKGKFLGRGAFGAVYAGVMADKLTGQSIPVALKLLQPDKNLPSYATASQKQQFEVEKQKWNKDPLKNACDAYLNARKELSILLTLHHEHIVPMLGLCLNPLSLVLSLAPLGALNERLREYQRSGDRLHVFVIRDIVVQVASALSYLHAKQIIYRDLKSENVLVWSLPAPHSGNTARTDVKLADYGVSRAVLPSGTKGFAGTQPFMAPEIIQHSGEEPYTEKVDCFSFGMFMYELLMLKIPYDGTTTLAESNINIRGHVLAGGRPAITNRELTYPPNVLDLMAVCWSRDPQERPSADEIVSFAGRPEFCTVLSAVAIDDSGDVVCACSVPFDETSSINGDEVGLKNEIVPCNIWLSIRSPGTRTGSLLVYTYREQECIDAKRLKCEIDSTVTAMCVTRCEMWCAVSGSAYIYIFRLADCSFVCKFLSTNRAGSTTKCLAFNPTDDTVYVVLDNGRFVVCNAALRTDIAARVRTECPGNERAIHCLTIRSIHNSGTELWCGQGQGKITIWNLHETVGHLRTVSHQEALQLPKQDGVVAAAADVVHLVIGVEDSNTVWSYIYPGTVVYSWDAENKTILGRIDLLHHMPSTSFNSPDAADHRLRAARCQVTSLCCVGDYIYIGSTFGCLITVDSHTLSVEAVCRTYIGSDPRVCSILPLMSFNSYTDEALDEATGALLDGPASLELGTSQSAACTSQRSLLVTIGRRYKDLVGDIVARYGRRESSECSTQNAVILVWSGSDWSSVPASSDCGSNPDLVS